LDVFHADRRFRYFLYATWLGGASAMALPFYILQATSASGAASHVAILLGAQTAGALLSNALWGWLGDARGKYTLLAAVAGLGPLPPVLALAWIAVDAPAAALLWFALVFAVLGALANGGVIAQLGYLMEISPDDRRPAYSGYFNALAAPAALLPIAGAVIVETVSLPSVFAASGAAAILQFVAVRRLRQTEERGSGR
jgi:MFS family permease